MQVSTRLRSYLLAQKSLSSYSRKTSWNKVIDAAITASMKANNSLSSGVVAINGSPDSILAPACIPGSSIGMLTGKNRNASSRFFPSEYMSTADIIEPIRAKSIAPMVNIKIRLGISAVLRFRNKSDENINESKTNNNVTIP